MPLQQPQSPTSPAVQPNECFRTKMQNHDFVVTVEEAQISEYAPAKKTDAVTGVEISFQTKLEATRPNRVRFLQQQLPCHPQEAPNNELTSKLTLLLYRDKENQLFAHFKYQGYFDYFDQSGLRDLFAHLTKPREAQLGEHRHQNPLGLVTSSKPLSTWVDNFRTHYSGCEVQTFINETNITDQIRAVKAQVNNFNDFVMPKIKGLGYALEAEAEKTVFLQYADVVNNFCRACEEGWRFEDQYREIVPEESVLIDAINQLTQSPVYSQNPMLHFDAEKLKSAAEWIYKHDKKAGIAITSETLDSILSSLEAHESDAVSAKKWMQDGDMDRVRKALKSVCPQPEALSAS